MKFSNIVLATLLTVGATFGISACGDTSEESSSSNYSTPSTNSNPDTNSNPNAGYTPPLVVKESQTYEVRTDQATITDSGRSKQKMDHVLLSADYDVVAMANAGYTTLTVDIWLEVKEIDDGYQYIFFYRDTKCQSKFSIDKLVDEYILNDPQGDPSLLSVIQFEHGGNKKDTSWSEHHFTAHLPIDRMTKDLYIRYGASGKYDDNWANRNVRITVTPSK